MKIYTEKSISEFNFWAGAQDTVKYLTEEQMDTVEAMLDEAYPEGMSDTQFNDFFWFEDDTIAEWLGYESFDELMAEVDAQ